MVFYCTNIAHIRSAMYAHVNKWAQMYVSNGKKTGRDCKLKRARIAVLFVSKHIRIYRRIDKKGKSIFG